MRYFWALSFSVLLIVMSQSSYAENPDEVMSKMANLDCIKFVDYSDDKSIESLDWEAFHYWQMAIFEEQNPDIDISEFRNIYQGYATGETEGNGCTFSHLPSIINLRAAVFCQNRVAGTFGEAYQKSLYLAIMEDNWNMDQNKNNLSPRYNP